MRLIDADALKEYPIRIDHYDKEHGNVHFVYGVESVLEYAEYLPTIDAVEVVRCKDCEHCADDWNGSQPMFTCELAKCGESVQPNDYCSMGERKSDD